MIINLTGTTCPPPDALRAWSILITNKVPTQAGAASIGLLGRLVPGEVGSLVAVEDAFDYQCLPEIVKGPNGPRLGHPPLIKVLDGIPVLGRVLVRPIQIIHLDGASPRYLEELRRSLQPAWDGRAHLLKHAGLLKVPEAGESVEILQR